MAEQPKQTSDPGKVGRIAGAAKVKGASLGKTRKPTPLDDTSESADHHDLGPWAETPASTRVERYRYDYAQRQVQVQWRNHKNDGYIYEDVPYEAFRSFARAVSKGKQVNRSLNSFSYGVMQNAEYDLPSNPNRSAIYSRVRA
jgi:hypothetical protein